MGIVSLCASLSAHLLRRRRPKDGILSSSPRSQFDEMREEAFAKTMRHPLESKFIHEGRQPCLLLAVAGGMAAGIGVSVPRWFPQG